ncbi:hypothetical protein EZS27_011691 [termite gut metagenome]|uniref:Anti-bacteriophage protein A/HamA C-terminal domain-containing protein n=1 Tax=termite gut metagenome TaxID=433724 RepID=A0A5J4S510_9ZZZZ
MLMHIHRKIDVAVIESFIVKFANKYIEQRKETQFDYSTLDNDFLFEKTGFNTDKLQEIIKKNAVHIDLKREAGLTPAVLNDIYRSDLGELLMTYYFEEKLTDKERFVIPFKNITFRELREQPGRGLDAIGYRLDENKVEILLGEAKVSGENNSPPAVVDRTNDSIYKSHKKHHENNHEVIRKLSDYIRRLNAHDAMILGCAIISIENAATDQYSITYGCTLIRDHVCVNEESDYGKMKSNSTEFEPHKIHFSILSFTGKTISETVDLFYKKVQELIAD